MLFTNERHELRKVFFRAWRKYREHCALEGVEQTVIDVALRHPQYHAVLENPQTYEDRDFPPEADETSPFLHMALHIAVHEQLATDRPAGVRTLYRALLARHADPHAAEH